MSDSIKWTISSIGATDAKAFTYPYMQLARSRTDPCNVTNPDHVVNIPMFICFCRQWSRMPPLAPNYELVVVPTSMGLVSVNSIAISIHKYHSMISTSRNPRNKTKKSRKNKRVTTYFPCRSRTSASYLDPPLWLHFSLSFQLLVKSPTNSTSSPWSKFFTFKSWSRPGNRRNEFWCQTLTK